MSSKIQTNAINQNYNDLNTWYQRLQSEKPSDLASRVSVLNCENNPNDDCAQCNDLNPWVRDVLTCQKKIQEFTKNTIIAMRDKVDEIAQGERRDAYELESKIGKLASDITWARAVKAARMAGIAILSCVGFSLAMTAYRYSPL